MSVMFDEARAAAQRLLVAADQRDPDTSVAYYRNDIWTILRYLNAQADTVPEDGAEKAEGNDSPLVTITVVELEGITRLVNCLNDLDGIEVTCMVHDLDGTKLGFVNHQEDFGYCFFPESGTS